MTEQPDAVLTVDAPSDDRAEPSFGEELLEGLREALAFKQGKLAARVRTYQRAGDTWQLVSDEMTTGPALREARTTRIDPPPAYDSARIRAVRAKLRFSQRIFAAALNVSPQTVQAWEQGVRSPSGPTLRLLEIAEQQPETFLSKIGA